MQTVSTAPRPAVQASPLGIHSGPVAKTAVGRLSGLRRGEESSDYPDVIARLNDRWRVIACKNSIQWILQERRGGSNNWRGYWFCRTREALVRGAREHARPVDAVALAVLLRLPAWIGGEP